MYILSPVRTLVYKQGASTRTTLSPKTIHTHIKSNTKHQTHKEHPHLTYIFIYVYAKQRKKKYYKNEKKKFE